MSEFNIEVQGGSAVRLPTAGKYCEKDIIVTSSGGGSGDLPDWDDDSPIIATGKGYVGRGKWELTEKGTLRWDTEGYGNAYFTNAISLSVFIPMWPASLDVLHKVKQVYFPDDTVMGEVYYMPNCERIRFPNNSSFKLSMTGMTKIKEINLNYDGYASKLSDYGWSNMPALEKVTLSPLTTTIGQATFNSCQSLKDINLENVTAFGNVCFMNDFRLRTPIIFNSELVSIGTQAFAYCQFPRITFQPPRSGVYPTIASNSFAGCASLLDIYVPWAEGEVANAPWGAINSKIHYNTQFDENGNPITE